MGRYLGSVQIRYLMLRALSSLFALFVLISACFMLVEYLPGSPFRDEGRVDPVILEILRSKYASDETSLVRYGKFLGSTARFEVGPSILRESLAPDFLRARALNSFVLGGLAFFFAVSLALAVSLLVERFRFLKSAFWRLSQFLISIPSLVLVPTLIAVFAVWAEWLPVARLDSLSSYVLPVMALFFRPFLSFSRILIQQMDASMQSPAVTAHRSFGFSEWQSLLKVVLPNSLIPLLMSLPNALSGLLSGSIIVETMFAIPGLGATFMDALVARDVYLISALVVGGGALLILSQLIVDVALTRLDPRVSLGGVK